MRSPFLPRLILIVAATALASACTGDSPEKLIASAQAYLAKNELNAATIEIKRAIEKAPESAPARQILGKVLLASGDPAAAEVEFRKAQQYGAADESVLPDLARTMLLLAQPAKITAQFGATTLRDATAQADLKTTVAAAYAQQGDAAKAATEIAAALAAVPMYPPAVMVQARMKADRGDVDGALQLLDAVLAKDPANEHAGVAKGYLLWFGKKDAAAALEAHRKVLAANPGAVAAQAEIVTLLFRQGKVQEARQQYESLRKTAPNHPQTLFFDAQFAYVDKDYKRARELTDFLLKAVPNHYRALELAGAAEYRMGNDAMAQAFLERALKVASGLVLSRQILAQSHLRNAQPARAVDVLTPLLEGPKADPESMALAGSAYLQLGDVRRADALFKAATGLSPDDAGVRTQVALAALSVGRAEIALRDLEAIAAMDKEPRADLALVSARIAQGDLRGALKAIDGLEEKVRDQPLPHLLRGQVQVALRDAAAARSSFEKALARDGKYFPALAALASLDMATRQPDAASARVDAFLKQSPRQARAWMLLADIAATRGAPPEEVLKHQSEAVRVDPTDAQAHLALVRRHLQFSDRPAALAAAQAAAAAHPDHLGILEALGQVQLVTGDSQQAISTFRKLTVQHPRNAQLHMHLAEAHVAAKDLDSAGRALKIAAELDPNLGEAHRGLAMLALQANRHDEALAIARDMQKRQPKDALGYAVEGDIEAQRRNWKQAAAAYRSALQHSQASEAAIKLHAVLRAGSLQAEADRAAADWERKRPNDPAFRYYLGDVATQQKDYATAEAHYRAVLSSQPRNALAMNNIAWLLLKQSKPGALEMAQQANALMPNRAPILDTLASTLAAAGRLPDAVKAQQQAVAASPQDPGLKLGLARHLIQAGKRDEARVQLQALEQLGERFRGHAEVVSLLKSL